MGRHQTKTCNVCFKAMRSDNLKRHMMRRDHLMDNNEDNVVNKEKKISCEDDRQSEGGEDHLTEQENEDNVFTLDEKLNMAAKILFLHPQSISPSPHFPEWINAGLEEQTIFSEGGEDQSETSDESGEDDDSNEDEDNVDVENRDDQSDISN